MAALRQRAMKMAKEEGAVAILLPSHEEGRNVDTGLILDDNGVELARDAHLRQNAVPIPYAVVVKEHYSRLARLAQAHVPVTVELNIQTAFTGGHEHGFNTIAEIPGTDSTLKEQVVMVGGHLDSWPAGTGATDNGAGAVIAMEAVRILKALDVKPKRTIRIALWSGEDKESLVPEATSNSTSSSLPLPRAHRPSPHRRSRTQPNRSSQQRNGKSWTRITTSTKAAARCAASTRRATTRSHPFSPSGSHL